MASRKYLKQKPIPLTVQLMRIKAMYGNVENGTCHKNQLSCVLAITPSEHSRLYRVKVLYKIKKRPQAILLSPSLEEVDGKRPHHLYGDDENGHPRLCVNAPEDWRYDGTMLLATSFIPWISTWLNTYEYWLITGEWHYPGRSPHDHNPKQYAA
jgi:hypothetical protein